MVEPEHPRLSIVRQCELVSISRSGFYHRPAGETPLNLALMKLIDALEDSEDVQNVYANYDLTPEVQAQLDEDE